MQVIQSQEENRRAACAKLADVALVLNDSLTSVNNKLVRLASDGYATRQRAIASLANYQSTGLLCADDVREAEALLRGEKIEATAERERDRQERAAAWNAERDLRREGYIALPVDDYSAMLVRSIVLTLGGMSNAELKALHEVLRVRDMERDRKQPKRKATKRQAAPKPTPFRVIEGGCHAEN